VDQNRTERWKELCKQAENERDPEKLLALVQEIDQLLEAEGEWRTRSRMQINNGENGSDSSG
jgi:hypothetical protein